jgi:riboflavin transporter FmnP
MSDFSHTGGVSIPQQQGKQGWSTKKLVILALFTALSLILSFVEVPIFPAAPFLKYDASSAVAALAACGFGPGAGAAVGIASAVIHGLIMGDPWGSLMTIVVLICWIVPIALIYRIKRTRMMLIVGLAVGSLLSLAGALGGNLLITPVYTGTTVEVVAAMIIPILLPFNALKLLINDVLVFLLLKPVENLVDKD